MASAVLTNRSEPNWPQHRGGGAGFMGKLPFSNSNPNLNPNPKLPNSKRIQSASNDASSINRRSKDANHSQYVAYNVASFSKHELSELKNRLHSEMEQIRNLRNRIESIEFQLGNDSNEQRKKTKPTSKKISGQKRPSQFNSVKVSKRSHSEVWNWEKDCAKLLCKLMKQKYGYVFNTPVDPVAMKLHDYFDIIKQPMDLGTVKSKLSKHSYSTPMEFAYDVRLTFKNALTYNPKGHEVHVLADELSGMFEQLFPPLLEKYEDLLRHERHNDEELPASSWNHVAPERVKNKEKHMTPAKSQREQPPPPRSPQPPPPQSPVPVPASSSNPPLAQSPVRTPSPLQSTLVKSVKQPKLKARDPNKRKMTVGEKHKLGIGLQSLPSYKMEQVVQIIRKRNEHLAQEEDEIELDLEAVDTETLRELDRLVTDYKKDSGELPSSEKIDAAPVEAKKPKRVEAGDEDVDIGDEMPMSTFPPVEIEKDKEVVGGNASSSSNSSSSSSSGSSSSSDSDSGSSSGSDSEADNGHS